MSDQLYRLAKNLRVVAGQHSSDLSIPAGTVVVAVAGLEAYVNELAEISLQQDVDRRAFDALRDNLVAKIRWFRDRAANSSAMPEHEIEDAALLYGLRGILMH